MQERLHARAGSARTFKGNNNMKLTKLQLKRIIKEELQQIMETNGYDMPSQDPYPVSPETGGGIWFPLLRELGAEDPTNPNREIGGLAVRIVDIFEKYGWEHPTETRPEAGGERGQREFERG